MNDLEALAALRAARELITPPERWTTGHLARNAQHYPVNDDDPTATCWCAIGAIRHVLGLTANQGMPSSVLWPINDAARARDHYSIATINDYLGHDAVLDAFDYAISRLEATTKGTR